MHIRAYRDSDLPLLCQIFLRAVRGNRQSGLYPGADLGLGAGG